MKVRLMRCEKIYPLVRALIEISKDDCDCSKIAQKGLDDFISEGNENIELSFDDRVCDIKTYNSILTNDQYKKLYEDLEIVNNFIGGKS